MRDVKRYPLVAGLFAALSVGALAPMAAHAQEAPAYTNGPTVLRAGPATEYPEVLRLPPGVPVRVMGCLPNYVWCDVALPDARGWVYGGRLNYAYEGGSVPLMQYGAEIGFPIVGFSIGTYWDHFYRGRPWFNERDRWEHRGPGGPGYGYGGPPRGGPGWGPHEGSHEGPGGAPHGGPGFVGGPQQHGGAGPEARGGPGPQAHGGPGPGGREGGGRESGHEGGHGGPGGQGGDHGGPPH